MRPEALELEGFTAFRKHTRVEFNDAELFALTGPTGAGKSSLIDAMIFALYGSVPRLGERAVEPVISKGLQEARIRLDFALAEERYTIVRVVRRTPAGGATTKEARLERGEAVLAANAKEMNEEIGKLIGLDFGQFTTCVALPQGEFARFLKQPPAERQKLLSQLLGLGIYDQVRGKASDARKTAAASHQVLNDQLDGLAHVNKAAVDERKKRLAAMEKLRELATKRLPELAGMRSDLADAKARQRTMEAQLEALDAIRTPNAVTDLAEAMAAAKKHNAKALRALNRADELVRETKAHRDSIGDPLALNNLRTQHSRKDELERDVEEAEQALADAVKTAAKRKATLQGAESAASAAQDALNAAQRTHAAHALRVHLTVGEPCPVCNQDVDALPTAANSLDFDNLQSAFARSENERNAAQRLYMEAATAQGTADGLWKAKRRECEEVHASLADEPPLPEVAKLIAAIETATRKLNAAERVRDEAKKVADSAAQALVEAHEREPQAWEAYHGERDGLADLSLSPPMPGTTLLDAWDNLEAWARDQVPKLQKDMAALEELALDLERRGKALNEKLAKTFAEHNVRFDDDAKAHVATAVAQAQFHLVEVEKQLADKRKYEKQAQAAQTEADVARALEQHLNAPKFPRWLLTAAFDRLVAGASTMLHKLSNGQYTFQRNDKFEFDVVDHGNAGETRTAKTLSGGETFLASLALALELSKQIADLAVTGTARLESIFLDEGFGSLDGETLDTVATAIEELSTQGRTVGIVTHVADLAERVPVRFKVSKTAATAVVERVAL